MCSHLSTISVDKQEKRILLLLSGWAGSGKDAAAAALGPLGFQRFAFADPLKADVAGMTGLPPAMFERPFKDQPLSTTDSRSPRDLLLAHAATARASDPDIYASAIANAILNNRVTRAVISDWRYQREGAFVESLLVEGWNVFRIRIERPGVIPSTAAIEHELDEYPMDLVVTNDGTLADLAQKLTNWLTSQL